ncbi:MAG: undecaprenyl-diphosphate phosphatase [Patescibacteria group bacterium]
MTVLQAFVLGAVQGLAEFLPISSSAHLVLVPWLLRWPDPGLVFDVALHLGTLLAVAAYFWRDWLVLIRGGLRGVSSREGRLFWFLAAASVPGALAGIALEKHAETVFRNPFVIAVLLMAMGLLILAADRRGSKRQRVETVSFGQSMLIGLSQALAIVPGVSRSGATMTAGLFLGLTREGAARFSFLLATPIVIGAGLYNLRHLARTPGLIDLPFVVGVATAAVVGFLCIGLFLGWLRRRGYTPFVWYRLCLGAAVLAAYLLRLWA